MNTPIDPGEGYRLLKDGDEFIYLDKWRPVIDEIGHAYKTCTAAKEQKG